MWKFKLHIALTKCIYPSLDSSGYLLFKLWFYAWYKCSLLVKNDTRYFRLRKASKHVILVLFKWKNTSKMLQEFYNLLFLFVNHCVQQKYRIKAVVAS